MSASHQAIREVVEAFNAGQVQLKIDFDFPAEAEQVGDFEAASRKILSDGPPVITISAIAREHREEPRLILITHRLGKTDGMSF